MRYQKQRNDAKEIEDTEPDFFIEEKQPSASVACESQEGDIEVRGVEKNIDEES